VGKIFGGHFADAADGVIDVKTLGLYQDPMYAGDFQPGALRDLSDTLSFAGWNICD
jgi:hypothetical protein